MIPEPFYNPYSCILYFFIRNPKLVKAGQIYMFFDSLTTKIHIVLLCYVGNMTFFNVYELHYSNLKLIFKNEHA